MFLSNTRRDSERHTHIDITPVRAQDASRKLRV